LRETSGAAGGADPGANPRATSVVSAAQPGTGSARAAAYRPTAGRQHEPAARVEFVLPSRGRNGGGGDPPLE